MVRMLPYQRMLLCVLLLVFQPVTLQAKSDKLSPYGLANFSEHYTAAVDTYYAAEAQVRAGRYAAALKTLETLWQKYPQGDPIWGQLPQNSGGIFTGHPPVYSALSMLTKVARTFSEGRPRTNETLQMTVLLPRQARGFDPANIDEARQNKGRPRTLRINPQVTMANYKAIREATWLFLEYLGALTGGVRWQLRFVELPITVDLENAPIPDGRISNNLGPKSYDQIWRAVDERIKKQTDFWVVVHPSNMPSNKELRHAVDFVRGGMASHPEGAPCVVADDLFLLQAPPHFGNGEKTFTPLERQLYHPQYFQHEIFHFIFARYPEYALEVKGHDWHQRGSWPSDFKGTFESDYYAEAFEKRILTSAKPAVSIFRFKEPAESMFAGLQPEDLTGTYQHSPMENGWHRGVITYKDGKYYWKNEAGAGWDLHFNGKGQFETNETNPYYKTSPTSGRLFRLRLKRAEDGSFTNQVEGYYFNGGNYKRSP